MNGVVPLVGNLLLLTNRLVLIASEKRKIAEPLLLHVIQSTCVSVDEGTALVSSASL